MCVLKGGGGEGFFYCGNLLRLYDLSLSRNFFESDFIGKKNYLGMY